MVSFIDIIDIKNHTLTIRDNRKEYGRKKKINNKKNIKNILHRQREWEDIYISTYPETGLISYIVLDFDNKDDPNSALWEAETLKAKLEVKGYNCILVRSGGKGYHLYVQTPYHLFNDSEFTDVASKNYNLRFKCYVDEIINEPDVYYTLDTTHKNAGLYSNIRLLGSKHPKTGETCHIIEGEFKEYIEPFKYDYQALIRAFKKAKNLEEEQYELVKKAQINKTDNLKRDTDLREVFKGLTNDYKEYKGYIMCNCIFHNDKHPSLRVTHDYYYCAGCNAKGNIYTLIKEGVISPYKDIDEAGLNRLLGEIT